MLPFLPGNIWHFALQCTQSTVTMYVTTETVTCWTWICCIISCVSWNSRLFQWHQGNYCCDCCLLSTRQKYKELWFSYGAVVLVSMPQLICLSSDLCAMSSTFFFLPFSICHPHFNFTCRLLSPSVHFLHPPFPMNSPCSSWLARWMFRHTVDSHFLEFSFLHVRTL